jgi:hypothetical protein
MIFDNKIIDLFFTKDGYSGTRISRIDDLFFPEYKDYVANIWKPHIKKTSVTFTDTNKPVTTYETLFFENRVDAISFVIELIENEEPKIRRFML